jgi:hypothetical protein
MLELDNCPLPESHKVTVLFVNEPAFLRAISSAFTVIPVPAPAFNSNRTS